MTITAYLTLDNLFWAGKLALALYLGFSLGLTMADIDLAPPLPLRHRSAWTHGPFIPLALWYLSQGDDWLRLFSLAFLPCYAIHLSYDMFPKAWQSIACVSLYPVPGRLPGILSFLYLFTGAVVALAVELLLLDRPIYLLIIGIGALISLKHYMNKEAGGWPWPLNRLGLLNKLGDFPPLLALTLAGLVAGGWFIRVVA